MRRSRCVTAALTRCWSNPLGDGIRVQEGDQLAVVEPLDPDVVARREAHVLVEPKS
jgi:hypothetical protein